MRLTIDGADLSARDGSSVLDAARQNDIYIPHLCSHPELSPYGGCRLCLVEVDGVPGCPPACTTLVRDGMVVRTKTDAVQALRREVLQLMLSEHPASCLVCPEGTECASFQGTIRKVGVTTGCRYCPKDGVCELQAVAKSLGVTELTLPIAYRDLPVERDEEFYDRDYNLCIYCARCVRMCQEQRQAAVLSFRRRGALTTIGPAFAMSHFEAGCEFCGACVSVCPTGALAEKGRKWAGAAERLAASVCPLCSEQCDIQAVVVKDRVVGTLPPGDPREAGGDLCVKGRFCLADLANHPDRLRVPTVRDRRGPRGGRLGASRGGDRRAARGSPRRADRDLRFAGPPARGPGRAAAAGGPGAAHGERHDVGGRSRRGRAARAILGGDRAAGAGVVGLHRVAALPRQLRPCADDAGDQAGGEPGGALLPDRVARRSDLALRGAARDAAAGPGGGAGARPRRGRRRAGEATGSGSPRWPGCCAPPGGRRSSSAWPSPACRRRTRCSPPSTS